MTDTPAESAEAPRTPEGDPLLSVVAYAAAIRAGDDAEAILRIAIHYAVRAAVAARDAEWREALANAFNECPETVDHLIRNFCAFDKQYPFDHECPECAPLRALLSEGKPGK